MRDFEFLSDLRRIRAFAEPQRLSILRLLAESPHTGSMLARELHAPANRVHYHLARLRELELVQEVAPRGGARADERWFEATARHYLVDPSLGRSGSPAAPALARAAEQAFLDWRREFLAVDLGEIARRVVRDSLRIEPLSRVLVMFGPQGLELAEAILVELEAAGARALPKLWSRHSLLCTLDRHDAARLSALPFVDHADDADLSAVVFVSSNMPQGAPPNAAQREKLPLRLEAISAWHRSLRARRIPYLEIGLPHRGELEAGDVSPEAAIDLFWRAVSGDARSSRARAEAVLRAAAEAGGELVLAGVNGDELRLAVDLEQSFASDGCISAEDRARGRTFETLPAGAAILLPIAGRAEGRARAAYTFAGGRHVREVELVFRAGRLETVDAPEGAERVRGALERAAGEPRALGAIEVGVLDGPRGLTGKPGLDMCLSGCVTLATGNNELLGGSVRSTLDLVFPCRAHTLLAGDRAIVTEGRLDQRLAGAGVRDWCSSDPEADR